MPKSGSTASTANESYLCKDGKCDLLRPDGAEVESSRRAQLGEAVRTDALRREFDLQGFRLETAPNEGDVLRLGGKSRLERSGVATALGRNDGEARTVFHHWHRKTVDAAIG